MLKGYECVWVGDNEVFKVKKDITSRVLTLVGEKLGKGLSYGTTKIMRGYKEPALYSDSLPPIGHLVFGIHGIGQNMESSDIIKSTAESARHNSIPFIVFALILLFLLVFSLSNTCSQVAKKHFPDKWKHKRVAFIPIEWRTWLTLDKGSFVLLITNRSIILLHYARYFM